jgi:alanine racemase
MLVVEETTEISDRQSLPMSRPTWAQISLSQLTGNFRALQNMAAADVQVMAVIKADAYGHGAVECARALEGEGCQWFGVALIEEGIELRRVGIRARILCLSGFWRGQADEMIAHRLTPGLYRMDAAEELNARAQAAGTITDYHLKVDTGLGRLGVPLEEFPAFVDALRKFTHIRMEGLWTHFAEADSPHTEFTQRQIEKYRDALRLAQNAGFNPTYHHLANSAGFHAHRAAHGNLVRTGALLYGLSEDILTPQLPAPSLQPVMSLHSRIIQLKTVGVGEPLGYGCTFTTSRESQIATIPIGYADGLRRALSNQGRVIVRTSEGVYYAPIVGRVSMDLTILDVTDVPDVATGDEIILLGDADGLRVTAEEQAAIAGTVSYEIVCGVSGRVPRVYA